jgi:two-component system, chemotaxis family, protein-glutamate methylesterase/glutaminase
MTRSKSQAIVIGGSAGALEALNCVLPALPHGFTLPIAVVLHLLPGRPSGLAPVLQDRSKLLVKEADDKEPIVGGTVYLGSPNYHLLIEKERCFSLSVDEPVLFSRPSIDVLFESAADAYGPGLIGVLLSGANEDGARGLARIHEAGGVALVQAPDSAATRAMPEAAIARTRVDGVLPPAELGRILAHLGAPAGTTTEVS